MTPALARTLGPTAFLTASLVLAWSSALMGALGRRTEHAPLVPIPWVGR